MGCTLQQIIHRVKHSFLLFPPNLVFSHFPAEPSRGPLQGPQARPEAQSHGGAEEQAATSRGGLIHGEGERPRPGPGAGKGTRSGPEQDVHIRGSASRAHGYELSGGNKYVNRQRDRKKASLDDHSWFPLLLHFISLNPLHQRTSLITFHPPPSHLGLPYLSPAAPLCYTCDYVFCTLYPSAS